MVVRPDVSGRSSSTPLATAETVVIGVLATASMWALGSAMLQPAIVAIAVLTPVALLITLRHSR